MILLETLPIWTQDGIVVGQHPFSIRSPWQVTAREGGTIFAVHPNGLRMMASAMRELDMQHWLHVSISREDCLPSYEDLCKTKTEFIGEDKTAIQVFPPKAKHVNLHPYCLHLWTCLTSNPLPDFTRGGDVI